MIMSSIFAKNHTFYMIKSYFSIRMCPFYFFPLAYSRKAQSIFVDIC